MIINQQIRNKILQNKPCYFPNAFEKIFSWNELENILNLRPFINLKRFSVLSNENYRWENQVWLSDPTSFPPSLLQNILKTHHCNIVDCSRINETVNNICAELENIFENSAVDAHIYFTVANILNGGFKTHWDYSHNLIIQVEGNTRFLLWDHFSNEVLNHKPANSLSVQPMYDVVLSPGDAVFVPLRSYHRAISKTKRLSISFPISIKNEHMKQDRNWIKLNL